MEEAMVEQIVRRWIDKYEAEIGKPRHESNDKRLEGIEDTMMQILGVAKFLKGAVVVITLLYTGLQILKLTHHI